MTKSSWYQLSPEPQRNQYRLTPVSPSGVGFLDQASALASNGSKLFVSSVQGHLAALDLNPDTLAFTPGAEVNASLAYQTLSPFWLGGQLHLLAYTRDGGILDFFRVSATDLQHLYRYQRTYGDTTIGFTTVHAFGYRDRCLFMGYNSNTGTSRIYGIQVPPQAPLSISLLWQSEWAKGWQDFCFFQLGGENFFFKHNPAYQAVNIDHYMDDPAQGSHPVGTGLPLPQETSAAATLTLQEGPGFAGYRADNGLLTVNRFHSDCQGWQQQAQLQAGRDYSHLLAIPCGGGKSLLALYG
ncbi:hypothetical protein EKK97_13165 [Billgrantia tianxiuensis]|jgi:hypothetical protein|uniref:Uncharacterized protein n=1 Tax=Billgrantia tianxiuensis TaxID=2497861 RepID=A0A6I6SRC8_9GAMM|nr:MULTISPECIES: hypothetical protein [Halomonas]MCE8034450.1 hypothetical protein [Halomonas sp. MCCC 1A11057]QHC50340.1 hypothetical protein EKK97_13165 [Halomonas tianxiuensis]